MQALKWIFFFKFSIHEIFTIINCDYFTITIRLWFENKKQSEQIDTNFHRFLCIPFAFYIGKRVRPGHATNFRWGDSGRVAYGITTQLQQILKKQNKKQALGFFNVVVMIFFSDPLGPRPFTRVGATESPARGVYIYPISGN